MILDGNGLTLDDLVRVARNFESVELGEEAKRRVRASRDMVERMAGEEKLVYGLTTGFGEFAQVKISAEQRRELQVNLLRSHACGVGKPLSEEAARGAMLLRANTLAKGNSGARVELIEKLLELLNSRVYPFVPEKGSVGASGDLAPLAHMALLLIGEGRGFIEGEVRDGAECLRRAGVEPIELREKEGLALINGTPVMTAIGALALYDSIVTLKAAEIACAMSIEALLASRSFLKEEVHRARGLEGQITSADNMRKLIDGSEIIESHRACRSVQDAYSLRCSPQVLGSAHDAIAFCRRTVELEMNAACDNPLILGEEVISAGNFHGEPVAQAMDFLAITVSEIGSISERRIFRYVDDSLSNLPAALVEKSGLNNGFMITQYIAASLASENKVLSHPASVDSIPTAANQEDHVSMGTIAARKARAVVDNVRRIVAIELLCAAQALDFRKPLEYGKGTTIAHRFIREELGVEFLEEDRSLSEDIERIAGSLEALVSYVGQGIELRL
jgi:histidine ammonia-lyase